MTITEVKDPKEIILNDFETFSKSGANNYTAIRKNAIDTFNKLGLPSTKNEEWKYTNLSAIFKQNLSAIASEQNLISKDDFASLSFLNTNCITIVLENGFLNKQLSSLNNLPDGIEILNLADTENNPAVVAHFNKYVATDRHEFAALNTAFQTNGVVISIKQNAVIDKTVYIVNISTSQAEAISAYTRTLVIANKSSQCKIGFITISQNENTVALMNGVNEIVVDENAHFEFDLIQNDNSQVNQITNSYIYQKQNSTCSFNTITLGGNLVRNNLALMLDGENIVSHLYGLYVLNGNQLVDNHTEVNHAKPHCNSNELYKGIIGGKATGVFNGKINVFKDAQKTNAYQSNKNILMSDDANMYSKPQLEIYADDVKCSHGSTTGQMDDEALFYLRARGINKNDAQALLNFAFASDVLQNITVADLHDYCVNLLSNKMMH